MRIEFWLDFLCPITYLTHKNLVEAITELGLQKYELYYRSYQLKEKDFSDSHLDVILKHHNSKNEAELLELLGNRLPNYTNFKLCDTNLAHQLAHLAKHKNLAVEVNQAIFKAYFEDNLDISNKDVLKNIANEVGLDKEEVEFTLNTRCYSNQIAINKENAANRGISEIPHLRINTKYNQNGYLSKEDIRNLIISIINLRGTKLEICGEYCDF